MKSVAELNLATDFLSERAVCHGEHWFYTCWPFAAPIKNRRLEKKNRGHFFSPSYRLAVMPCAVLNRPDPDENRIEIVRHILELSKTGLSTLPRVQNGFLFQSDSSHLKMAEGNSPLRHSLISLF